MFALDDNHIIVNYHYVEEPKPGIYPCAPAVFEKQVRFLKEHYRIVSVPEVFESARDGKNERLCAITFDDGLKDQHQNALPILNKYSLGASFFPITSAFEGRLPAAHKVHVLLSRFSIEEMIDFFHRFIAEIYPDLKSQYFIPKDRRLTDKRMHEDVPWANFKETLIALPEDIKGRFLRHCFKVNGLSEHKISQKLFMSREEVKELQKSGMTIGGHSHGHYAMSIEDEAFLGKDIELSLRILTELLGAPPEVFSYPHGRYGNAARKVVKDAGFRYALTIERRGVRAHDDPFVVPRYDTADLSADIHG